ncbi:SDR family oxidoreductase [Paludisphaera rhizosphaerae]|uniref:SDR family oxidoreductase n=1 Tax=Paludisphaera rhizosphaerae TaxID=2711216 RepID=UPI0013E9D944|nr:SDR family oxidoreductase [Paludisphaera rhizosphaerae]
MAKTVLITGASSGFGKDVALLFHEKGWNVAASMRTPEKAESWSQPGLFTPRIDVTDPESVRSGVAATVEKFGGVDVLVNNAGYAVMGPLEGVSQEDLRRQFDTNVIGLAQVTKEVLPVMRKAGHGTIVNVSSMGGRLTFPLLSAYHASKFAVEGLTESLQYELDQFDIRLKLVEPGGSKTNFGGSSMTRAEHPAYRELADGFEAMTKAQAERLPGPEKVAATIYRAATDPSRRLRYPVIAWQYFLMRRLFGDSGWSAMMRFMARRSVKLGRA